MRKMAFRFNSESEALRALAHIHSLIKHNVMSRGYCTLEVILQAEACEEDIIDRMLQFGGTPTSCTKL